MAKRTGKTIAAQRSLTSRRMSATRARGCEKRQPSNLCNRPEKTYQSHHFDQVCIIKCETPMYGVGSWFMTLSTDDKGFPDEHRGDSGFGERIPEQECCAEVSDGILYDGTHQRL